jgi:heat shock protein HslJ
MTGKPGRLSADILTGREWLLSRWGFNEPVEEGIRITLQYADGIFTGHSACNRYFAGISEDADLAGGITVGAVGGTRMACPGDHLSAAEQRYLQALQHTNRISFVAGDLVLSWGQGSDFGTLYFSRQD